jgi:hypothetical protein
MITELIELNGPQQLSVINDAKNEVDIEGRGTGKSYKIGWEINQIVRKMPRSITSITGRTYGQIYTRTLPSTLKFLEKLGYEKDKDFKIGGRPDKKLGFAEPYEKITKQGFDNFISFANGTGFMMLSQERAGSSRGPNLDREIVDEALTLNKERYDEEVSPANRGNEEYFGFKAPKRIKQHHGFRYVSSMPYTRDQMWLLRYGDYYKEEAGIQIFDIWNRIVKLQLQVIDAAISGDKRLFKDIWNETVRMKKQIAPFVSKDGLLFTLANAFDNVQNLGMSYITREYKKQTLLTFMIEILNWIIDKVEDCYYPLDSQKHIYYDAYNDDFIRGVAENSNWDADQLSTPDCRFDLDCDPNRPLEIVPDWGAKINLFSIGQERNYNFATKMVEPVDCVINEFSIKPQDAKSVPVDDLVDMFCDYYKEHPCRDLFYFRDRYGDHRQPNVKNSKPYNEQAIERLMKRGWRVTARVHRGMEPPQHDKYLMWANILKGNDPRYPKWIINGRNCKYTIISMNNTRVIERDGKFDKDKSSERKDKILPEEATHFGDAVDKRMWTKYGDILYQSGNSTFVSPRL